jgi:hypothetical protein
VLKQLAALVVAVAVIVVFIRELSFGESPPERARPAPSASPASPAPSASAGVTATPTPTPDPDTLAITVTHDRVTVRPRSARREAHLLPVFLENRATYMIEVVFLRDAPPRGEARRTIVALGTGEQRRDRLALAAGRYSVVARPLTEGDASPAPAIGFAALRVR